MMLMTNWIIFPKPRSFRHCELIYIILKSFFFTTVYITTKMYSNESYHLGEPAAMTMPNLREWLIKGALTSAIARTGAYLLGEKSQINLLGMQTPSAVAIGLSAGVGSIAADGIHQYVLPLIPANEKYQNVEAAALGIFSSSAATAIVSSVLGNSAILPMALLGGSSYVASDWSFHTILTKPDGSPMWM